MRLIFEAYDSEGIMQSLLIIDDNVIFRRTVAAILSSRFPALKIIQAKTPSGALVMCRRRDLGLVLMDIDLNEGNGLTLLKEIRRRRPHTRIAVVTDKDTMEYQKAAFGNGADYFFSKSGHDGRSIIRTVCDCLAIADRCPVSETVPLPIRASLKSYRG